MSRKTEQRERERLAKKEAMAEKITQPTFKSKYAQKRAAVVAEEVEDQNEKAKAR